MSLKDVLQDRLDEVLDFLEDCRYIHCHAADAAGWGVRVLAPLAQSTAVRRRIFAAARCRTDACRRAALRHRAPRWLWDLHLLDILLHEPW